MKESSVQTLFDAAAEEIAVGPVPTMPGIEARARTRRRTRVAVTVGAAGTTAGAVVVGVALLQPPSTDNNLSPSGRPGVAATRSAGTTTALPTSLTCPTRLRNAATLDDWSEDRSSATPQQLGDRWSDASKGEHAIVAPSADESKADAFMVRSDGTALGVLHLRYTPSTGWSVDTLESCEDDPLIPLPRVVD